MPESAAAKQSLAGAVVAVTSGLRADVSTPSAASPTPEAPAQATQPTECKASHTHHFTVRLRQVKLFKRMVDLDLEHCPSCGGEQKIIAAILEQPVIEQILTHLGLQAGQRLVRRTVHGLQAT